MKEWIYIVSWTLISVTFNDCPEYNQIQDEFGRTKSVQDCSGNTSTKKIFIDREFGNNRKKAMEFYDRAMKQKKTLIPNNLIVNDYFIFLEIDSSKRRIRKNR